MISNNQEEKNLECSTSSLSNAVREYTNLSVKDLERQQQRQQQESAAAAAAAAAVSS